jgi:hypothetical protein
MPGFALGHKQQRDERVKFWDAFSPAEVGERIPQSAIANHLFGSRLQRVTERPGAAPGDHQQSPIEAHSYVERQR